MNTEVLSEDKDPMGAAILDFQKQGKAGPIESALFYVRGRRNASETSLQKRCGNAGAGAEGLAAHKGTCTGYRSRKRLPYARLAGEGLYGERRLIFRL